LSTIRVNPRFQGTDSLHKTMEHTPFATKPVVLRESPLKNKDLRLGFVAQIANSELRCQPKVHAKKCCTFFKNELEPDHVRIGQCLKTYYFLRVRPFFEREFFVRHRLHAFHFTPPRQALEVGDVIDPIFPAPGDRFYVRSSSPDSPARRAPRLYVD
jgi:hypothetical protein